MAPYRHPFLDADGPIAFAHRGGAAGGLENTMAAFQRAVDLGYRYVETDARVTADGVLVAFHDPHLRRVAGVEGRLGELTWERLSTARVGGREPVPRLEELLATFPDLRVNIDVKEAAAVRPLVELLTRRRALDRVCVGSFSARRLAACRQALGPRLATSLGPPAVLALRAACVHPSLSWLAPPCRGVVAAQIPPQAASVPVVTERLVRLAHDRGLAVHVWTVDDAAEMRRLLDLGVDGLMTDELETLRGVLRERGRWPG